MSVTRVKKEKDDSEELFDMAVEDLGWRGNKKVALHFYKLGMITAETKKKLFLETKKTSTSKTSKKRVNR
jgi:hypothetical protein